MVGEIDKATEARRKALRNGEEDPFIVAQRFLNIYRQMHIFSPERKEAFNKMLLELSPDIQNLFSSLPGGVMLQDYVDDLIKANGGKPQERTEEVIPEETKPLPSETSQQAEILAAALAKAQQSQSSPQVVAAGTSKLSIDKDFAEEFAKVIGSLLEKQTASQKESLEKITTDISKTQLFLAKNLKESKEEQHQDLSLLLKNITDIYQAEREQQRQNLGEICKAIAQSQTALSLSMSNQPQVQAAPANSTATSASSGMDAGVAKKLIDMFLEGQKQLNSRLEKVEIAADSRLIENEKLLKAFEQTQATMLQKMQENTVIAAPKTSSSENRDDEKLVKMITESQENLVKTLMSANIQQSNITAASVSPTILNTRDDEKLVKMITESQENLIKTLINANFQQNAQQNNVAQTSSNSNNIQINTPDNSAQMTFLIDKIISMQTSNQQSLEKALVSAIKEQGEVYHTISAKQTKELATVIAESLKNIQPVYVPTNAPISFENAKQISIIEENDFVEKEKRQEKNITTENREQEAEELNVNELLSEKDAEDFISEQENPSKKKKKKRKKKRPQESIENEEILNDLSVEEQKNITRQKENEIAVQGTDVQLVVPLEEKEETIKSEILAEIPERGGSFQENLEDNNSFEEEIEQKKETKDSFSDWGFSSDVPEENIKETADDWGFSTQYNNLNNGEEEKDDSREEDDFQEDNGSQDEVMEAIGDNSYIGISSSYEQLSEPSITSTIKPLEIRKMPIIYDDSDEGDEIDPYQNSILKD